MGTFLSSNVDIIHSKTFECPLVKKIDNREHELLLNEKESVNKLLKQSEITPITIDHDLDFASKLLKKRKLEKMSSDSRYVNCKFLVPTSYIAERFFSAAGYAIGHLRHNIVPSNLEMQMFLCVNKRFWDRKML